MTKIIYKDTTLRNVIIPGVESSRTYTKSALNSISSWAIPYNFSERYNLTNCINELSTINKDLKSVEKFLNRSVKSYSSAEKDMENGAQLLPTKMIQLRKSLEDR